VADHQSSLSAIPLELYNSETNLTLYCEDILGTVPTLKQFASLAISQTLLRKQIFKEYLFREYPSRCCVQHVA
jgi:hypothetical protein